MKKRFFYLFIATVVIGIAISFNPLASKQTSNLSLKDLGHILTAHASEGSEPVHTHTWVYAGVSYVSYKCGTCTCTDKCSWWACAAISCSAGSYSCSYISKVCPS